MRRSALSVGVSAILLLMSAARGDKIGDHVRAEMQKGSAAAANGERTQSSSPRINGRGIDRVSQLVTAKMSFTVHYQEFSRHHDSINWRGTLEDGLLALIGKERRIAFTAGTPRRSEVWALKDFVPGVKPGR